MKIKPCLTAILSLLALFLFISGGILSTALANSATGKRGNSLSGYGKTSLYFIRNTGQIDSSVKYYVKGDRGTIFFKSQSVVFQFFKENPLKEKAIPEKDPAERHRERRKRPEQARSFAQLLFRFRFGGARQEPVLVGRKKLAGKINYLVGSRDRWRTNIPIYEEIVYQGIYEGIDLMYRFEDGRLQYTFVVSPGTDPGRIVLFYEGVEGLKIRPDGRLVILTSFGGFVEKIPSIYQEISGKRVAVEGRFKNVGEKGVTFDMGTYDSSYPLLIS